MESLISLRYKFVVIEAYNERLNVENKEEKPLLAYVSIDPATDGLVSTLALHVVGRAQTSQRSGNEREILLDPCGASRIIKESR